MQDFHKPEVINFLDQSIPTREKWIQRSGYYYRNLSRIISNAIASNASVCHVGCDSPYLLKSLPQAKGTGICMTEKQKVFCETTDPDHRYTTMAQLQTLREKFDYIVITSLGYFFDVQEVFHQIQILCHFRTRIIIINCNLLWEPLFYLGEKLRLRMPQSARRQNMVPTHHVINLLSLSRFQLVKWSSHILVPYFIPLVSWFFNRILASSFPFRYLSSTDIIIARPQITPPEPVTCSVIVPCKNEKGNIESLVRRIPALADETEIVLVDDRSSDGTGEEMRRCQKTWPDKKITVIEGPGISKGEAVRMGIEGAAGRLIAIFDADLAVLPEELPKCILPLLEGTADFVNTVRFVYPQQDGAMRWLNIAGNRGFSLLFTFLIRQRVSDTLCGTKVFWKEDYRNISGLKDYWLWRDRWGDFEQLLGASKLGLKIVEVPIHYAERTYGETKMKNRFQNGLHMLKLCLGGFIRLRLQ